MVWAHSQGGLAAPGAKRLSGQHCIKADAWAMLYPAALLRPQRAWESWPLPGPARALWEDSEGGLQGLRHENAKTQELRIQNPPQVALTEVLKSARSCCHGPTEVSRAAPPLLVQGPRAGHPQCSTFMRTGQGVR